MLVFDIGANRGKYTDALLGKYDNFVLVEPNLKLCDELKIKYQNNPKNITILNNIVSTTDTIFYECTSDTISTCDIEWIKNSRFANHGASWKPLNIPSITIDSMIEKYGIPTILKIDVEGYEWNVIQTLSSSVPRIEFEWAEEKKDELYKTIEYLHNKLGYNKFFIKDNDIPYDYTPSSYNNYEDSIRIIDRLNESRKKLWGMVYVTQ